MSSSRHRLSLLVLATCLTPAFVFAIPLAAGGTFGEELSRRGNPDHIPCGNAPTIIAGYPVTAADIVISNPNESPPPATTDPSGYFPYVWCSAGTSTYVFIDPIGNYGYNKGTDAPIFWTALDGAQNGTINTLNSPVFQDRNKPTGDGPIDNPDSHETSLDWRIPVSSIAGTSGINYVEIFVQDANHQKLTYGIYQSALIIMKDFVTTYPLYADTMYFQIGDSHWSTVGNGYVGIVMEGSGECILKGTEAQNNTLPCAMPRDYPDN